MVNVQQLNTQNSIQPKSTQQPQQQTQRTQQQPQEPQQTQQEPQQVNHAGDKDIFKYGINQHELYKEENNTNNLEEALMYSQKTFLDTGVDYNTWKYNIDIYLDLVRRSRYRYIPSVEQYRSILTYTDRQLVEACPGSGKTTTMVHKVVVDGIIHGYKYPDQLVVTYAEQSAQDMTFKYGRALSLINKTPTAMFSTIHSFSKRVKDFISPSSQVLTDTNELSVIYEDENLKNEYNKSAMEQNTNINSSDYVGSDEDDEDDYSFFDRYDEDLYYESLPSYVVEKKVTQNSIYADAVELTGLTGKYMHMLNDVIRFTTLIVEKDITTEEQLRGIPDLAERADIKLSDLQRIYRSAKELRLKYSCTDFTDMLLDTYKYLKSLSSLEDIKIADLKSILQKKAIYVDEFQDISPIQFKIINEILRLNPTCRLFCVGDTDQAIYSFRGAEPKYLLSFSNLEFNKGKYIDTCYFTVNRRSTENIVKFASYFIKHNKVRYNKTMKSINKDDNQSETDRLTQNNTLKGIKLIQTKNMEECYDDIHSNIKKLLDNGTSHEQIAVVARENILLTDIAGKCIKDRIKINCKPNILPTNTMEYRDIIGILKFITKTSDANLVKDYLYKIFKDYTKADSVHIAESVRKTGKPFTTFLKKLNSIEETVVKLRTIYKMVKSNAKMGDIIKIIANLYVEAYYSRVSQNFTRLNAILNFLNNYSQLSYDKFLAEEFTVKNWISREGMKGSGIMLGTMHRVKGLEFDNVFLYGIGSKYTPKQTILDNIGEKYIDSYIEEERRLLFVGMTRARENLNVYFDNDGGLFAREMYTSYEMVKNTLQNQQTYIQ